MFAAGYLLLCVATLAVVVVLRQHTAIVNAAVWIRGSLVAIAAVITNVLALRGDVRRLRIVTIAQIVAISLIVALPGPFPLWLKIEQIACGLLLIGVVATLPRRARSGSATVSDDAQPGPSPDRR
ncbi:hypothetical protein [Dactylosporangium salmoneum]|uniref:Integral membrane protein n=1 Tax=Dactylosporangium salmoneum TaxID=53361 RepID=A0ABN3HE84_9ACTN